MRKTVLLAIVIFAASCAGKAGPRMRPVKFSSYSQDDIMSGASRVVLRNLCLGSWKGFRNSQTEAAMIPKAGRPGPQVCFLRQRPVIGPSFVYIGVQPDASSGFVFFDLRQTLVSLPMGSWPQAPKNWKDMAVAGGLTEADLADPDAVFRHDASRRVADEQAARVAARRAEETQKRMDPERASAARQAARRLVGTGAELVISGMFAGAGADGIRVRFRMDPAHPELDLSGVHVCAASRLADASLLDSSCVWIAEHSGGVVDLSLPTAPAAVAVTIHAFRPGLLKARQRMNPDDLACPVAGITAAAIGGGSGPAPELGPLDAETAIRLSGGLLRL